MLRLDSRRGLPRRAPAPGHRGRFEYVDQPRVQLTLQRRPIEPKQDVSVHADPAALQLEQVAGYADRIADSESQSSMKLPDKSQPHEGRVGDSAPYSATA